jgi:hypothetical protein
MEYNIKSVIDFIKKQCIKYNIDESHGVKHAIGTFVRARDILETFNEISAEERKMALYSAALHDMCDSKYMKPEEASEEIRGFLLSEEWTKENADSLIRIINTMSYSKLKALNYDVLASNGNLIFPDHGKWQRAYHIARHADLLEGYIVARCVLYSMHFQPEKSEDECWSIAEDLFKARVFKYISDGWIFLPGTKKMALILEKEAHRCFLERSMEWNQLDL